MWADLILTCFFFLLFESLPLLKTHKQCFSLWCDRKNKKLRKPKKGWNSVCLKRRGCALFSSWLYRVCHWLSPEGPSHPISCSLYVRAPDLPSIIAGWNNQWPALWEYEGKRFIYLTNYTGLIMESLNAGALQVRIANVRTWQISSVRRQGGFCFYHPLAVCIQHSFSSCQNNEADLPSCCAWQLW